jgi:hypothetical protein
VQQNVFGVGTMPEEQEVVYCKECKKKVREYGKIDCEMGQVVFLVCGHSFDRSFGGSRNERA